MTPFEFISVALSFVLGLGITRLLSSAINVFRRRDQIRVHWVPLVWAGVIFLFQIQYWWAIFELSDIVTEWTLLRFVTLLGMAIFLFVAGALVLPWSKPAENGSLLLDFEHNGRWALIFLCIYFIISLWGNWYFWQVTLFDFLSAIVVALIVGLVLFLVIPSQRIRGILTVLYMVLTVYACLKFSPAVY